MLGILHPLSCNVKYKCQIQSSKNKKHTENRCVFLSLSNQNLSLSGETIAAVNRTIGFRLERNLCFAATGSAYCCIHLSGSGAAVLAGISARLASLGLILETFFSVEILLTCSEDKFCTTVFANKGLVLIH